jgi:hypothetical protein
MRLLLLAADLVVPPTVSVRGPVPHPVPIVPEVVALYPTAHPSFTLIGFPGVPKVTDVKLYADCVDGKSAIFGAGTMFHVEPS